MSYLAELVDEIIKGERSFKKPLGRFFGRFLFKDFFGLFDKRENVTHSKDAFGHPVRMKLVEIFKLLACRSKSYRSTHYFLNREGRTASGITIKFGEDDPV